MNPMTGREEPHGTSIVDVTDPKNPRYLAHVPGQPLESGGTAESGGAQQVRVCSGATLPRGDKTKTYLLRAYGNTANSAHEMWDVTDPSKPTRINVIVSGLRGTRELVGVRYRHCLSGVGAAGMARPAHGKDLRPQRSGQAGVHPRLRPARAPARIDGDATGRQRSARAGVHRTEGQPCLFRIRLRARGVVQIVDRDKLLNGPKPTEANLLYPQISRMDMPPSVGAHNVFPLLRIPIAEFAKEAESVRDMLVIVDEAIGGGCMATARAMMWIADITTETRPFGASNWTMPNRAAISARAADVWDALVARELHPDLLQPDHVHRALQRRHSRGGRAGSVPPEIGYYVPALTAKTACTEVRASRARVIQTNNVEVDDRGYVYGADRAGTGMHSRADGYARPGNKLVERLDDLSTECDGIAFHLYSFEVCSTYRSPPPARRGGSRPPRRCPVDGAARRAAS